MQIIFDLNLIVIIVIRIYNYSTQNCHYFNEKPPHFQENCQSNGRNTQVHIVENGLSVPNEQHMDECMNVKIVLNKYDVNLTRKNRSFSG